MTLEELEEAGRRRRDEDLRAALSTAEGRRFVWHLIEEAGTVAGSFSADALTTAYREGARSAGIKLLTEAQRVAPQLFLKMFSEQVAEAQLEAQLREKAEAEEGCE